MSVLPLLLPPIDSTLYGMMRSRWTRNSKRHLKIEEKNGGEKRREDDEAVDEGIVEGGSRVEE